MADESARPIPRPVRERGYAHHGTSGWLMDLSDELTPELVWPASIAVFDRMRRQDAQVASVLRAVKAPILRTQWRIDGTGCREEVTRYVAANLGLPIVGEDAPPPRARGRERFSWIDHLRLALLELDFGHSFFEQVYRDDPNEPGMYRLRKLGPRLPKTIARINVARDGGLISIEQRQTPLRGSLRQPRLQPPLPVNRLVAYVLEREGGNWLGQSLLRTAYKNWLLKDQALRTWSTAIDRQGMGIPVYVGADHGQDETKAEADLDLGEEIAASMRAGDNSGAAIPNGSTLKLLGVEGETPDPEKFVQYNDAQIARSALGHFLTLGGQTHGQVGSYNLGSVFRDTFDLSLDMVAEGVGATTDAHVIEDLVDINFGPTEPAPRLVYDEIGTRQTELDRIREATGLSSDADLVKFLRRDTDQEVA